MYREISPRDLIASSFHHSFCFKESKFAIMENITTGHWIFAGIFAIAFLTFLFISYRKDLAMHKIHYRSGGIQVALLIVITLFVLFVFKRLF